MCIRDRFTGDLNEDQLRTMGYADDQIKSIMEMGKTANDAATKVKTFTQLFDTLKEAAPVSYTHLDVYKRQSLLLIC